MTVHFPEARRRMPAVTDGLCFTDMVGADRQVFELLCASGRRCLIFESLNALRRVWEYPEAWTRLAAGEPVQRSWTR